MARITPRQAEALELRRTGLTYARIGKGLGVSAAQAHRLVTKALTRVEVEDLPAVRQLELDRLDALLSAVWPLAIEGDDKAIQRSLDIMERRSRLLGLDAPKVTQETHRLEVEISAPELDAAIRAALEARGVGGVELETIDAEVMETPHLALSAGVGCGEASSL